METAAVGVRAGIGKGVAAHAGRTVRPIPPVALTLKVTLLYPKLRNGVNTATLETLLTLDF